MLCAWLCEGCQAFAGRVAIRPPGTALTGTPGDDGYPGYFGTLVTGQSTAQLR
jgi:hypothetical protein